MTAAAMNASVTSPAAAVPPAPSTTSSPRSPPRTTSPTGAWRRRSSSRSRSSARSSSKASPASARPSSPRRWRGRCRRCCCACSATKGLDVAQTAYEWNVARQMMEIRLAEAAHDVGDAASRERLAKSLYARSMLIERPLLQALTQARSPVLLIDELDRADEPFDAFLLEVLAENQLTIPELGTVKAARRRGADRRHHQQPHARDPRRAEAPLPLSLGRLSRRSSASSRSCASARRARPSASPRRSSPSCSGCARSTCSRRPASPRRSTGATRWSR